MLFDFFARVEGGWGLGYWGAEEFRFLGGMDPRGLTIRF